MKLEKEQLLAQIEDLQSAPARASEELKIIAENGAPQAISLYVLTEGLRTKNFDETLLMECALRSIASDRFDYGVLDIAQHAQISDGDWITSLIDRAHVASALEPKVLHTLCVHISTIQKLDSKCLHTA